MTLPIARLASNSMMTTPFSQENIWALLRMSSVYLDKLKPAWNTGSAKQEQVEDVTNPMGMVKRRWDCFETHSMGLPRTHDVISSTTSLNESTNHWIISYILLLFFDNNNNNISQMVAVMAKLTVPRTFIEIFHHQIAKTGCCMSSIVSPIQYLRS